jgi:hypothetical protein
MRHVALHDAAVGKWRSLVELKLSGNSKAEIYYVICVVVLLLLNACNPKTDAVLIIIREVRDVVLVYVYVRMSNRGHTYIMYLQRDVGHRTIVLIADIPQEGFHIIMGRYIVFL